MKSITHNIYFALKQSNNLTIVQLLKYFVLKDEMFTCLTCKHAIHTICVKSLFFPKHFPLGPTHPLQPRSIKRNPNHSSDDLVK